MGIVKNCRKFHIIYDEDEDYLDNDFLQIYTLCGIRANSTNQRFLITLNKCKIFESMVCKNCMRTQEFILGNSDSSISPVGCDILQYSTNIYYQIRIKFSIINEFTTLVIMNAVSLDDYFQIKQLDLFINKDKLYTNVNPG